MENKHIMLGVAGGVAIAAGIITWLLSSSVSSIPIGNGVTVQPKTSMTNTVVSREKDGAKLWEFQVKLVEQDRKKDIAYLTGISGKIYRKDGSYIDIVADKGEATVNRANNNFMLAGNVKAILSSGGKIYGNKFTYIEKYHLIRAYGKVRMQKDDYTAYGDYAETTTELQKFKLKGHAKVEKGGVWNDK